MGKSPLLSKFLELMVVAEQISGVAVLRSVVADNFLWDSNLANIFFKLLMTQMAVFWRISSISKYFE